MLDYGCASAFGHGGLFGFFGIVLAWARIPVGLEHILAAEVHLLEAVTEGLSCIVEAGVGVLPLVLDGEVCQLLPVGDSHELGGGFYQFHCLFGVVEAGWWVAVGHELVLLTEVSLVLDVRSEGLEVLRGAGTLVRCLLNPLYLTILPERDHLGLLFRRFRSP